MIVTRHGPDWAGSDWPRVEASAAFYALRRLIPLSFHAKNAYEPPTMTQFRLSLSIRIIGPAFRAL
ncbi:hypothetical protein NXC24_CH00803 [Rhizobium sp. NXC24]|nr:hypothetical protein NXC24_CH00803 [Rhizobium sp. NXC24]